MRWVENVVCKGAIRNAHKLLVEKHGGKKLLGRPWHRWESNTTDVRM
jgi:hypothetical protein